MQWPSLAFCNFSTKGQIRYARKTNSHDIFFFNYWIISSAGSLLTSKIFTLGKYCNYPLTTMQGDCLASYKNIVSQSQTLSLPPPRFRPHVVRTLDNTIHCINHYQADKYYRETNYIIHWVGIYLVDSVIQLLSSRMRSSVWQRGPNNS